MIKVLIISINGHEDVHLPVAEAVSFIKDNCNNRGKWVFLDEHYVNPDSINEKLLQDAKEIILTNSLVAG